MLGTIEKIEPHGMFIRLPSGEQGLMRVTEYEPNADYRVGKEIPVEVLCVRDPVLLKPGLEDFEMLNALRMLDAKCQPAPWLTFHGIVVDTNTREVDQDALAMMRNYLPRLIKLAADSVGKCLDCRGPARYGRCMKCWQEKGLD